MWFSLLMMNLRSWKRSWEKNLRLKVHNFSRDITNTEYNLISCFISGLKMLCLVMARILDKPDFFQVLFQSIGLMKKSGVRLFGLHVNLLTTLSLVFWAYETKRVLCKYIGCSLGIRDRRILHWLHRSLQLKIHSLWLLLEFLIKTLSIYLIVAAITKKVDTHLYTSCLSH